jgi:AraC-like DNA-binding protein
MSHPVFEKLIPQGDSFIAFVREADRFPFSWHYHPEYEIVAILKGEGERFVGDHLDLYRAGDLVMTGPGLPHAWCSKEHGGRNRAAVIQFGDDFLGPDFFGKPEMAPLRQLLTESRHGVVFAGAARTRALALIEAMLKLEGFPRLLKLLELLELLGNAKTSRKRLSSRLFDQVPADADQDRLERAFTMIFRHYQEPLRQAEVAKSLNMTPETFSRLFKRHCGNGFTQSLIEYRVAMACRLLQETGLQVMEVGERCGFRNLANFNRQFLKLKKCSPRTYRQRWK